LSISTKTDRNRSRSACLRNF